MKKFIVLILVGVGGWFFLQNFAVDGLDQIRIRRKAETAGSSSTTAPESAAPPVARDGNSIRLASFNIQVFGTSKENKPQVMDILVDVVRRFDVVAIQEIRSKDQGVMPRFVDRLNAEGRKYDFVIGPRLGRTTSKEQYAFVYDTQSLEVDPTSVYTVDDPDDLLHREPLVAAFRVRGPPANEAFTFTLINIHTDPDETDQELDALDDVYRTVRNDGRGEDDIILLGDLNVDDRHLGELGQISGITWLLAGVPTNTRGTSQYDNIILHGPSTVEFTGRVGVFDLMREFNLTMDQALDVSDHLPVWAEFSLTEGTQPGRIAKEPSGTTR